MNFPSEIPGQWWVVGNCAQYFKYVISHLLRDKLSSKSKVRWGLLISSLFKQREHVFHFDGLSLCCQPPGCMYVFGIGRNLIYFHCCFFNMKKRLKMMLSCSSLGCGGLNLPPCWGSVASSKHPVSSPDLTLTVEIVQSHTWSRWLQARGRCRIWLRQTLFRLLGLQTLPVSHFIYHSYGPKKK